MIYTYVPVSESGSFSSPDPCDARNVCGKENLEFALGQWAYIHDRAGADRMDASLMVWRGVNRDVTTYPDYIARFGPRGGFHLDRA